LLSNAYISAFSGAGLTISGPPDALIGFSKEAELSRHNKAMLPVRSPYHAAHLFSDEDISMITQRTESWAYDRSAASIPVVSCGTGHSVWTASPHTMLESAIQDILIRPMRVERSIDHLATSLRSSPTDLLIVPIGTDAVDTIQRRLKSAFAGCEDVSINVASQAMSTPSTLAANRPKIAVIGMSGRFPGASSPEELWTLLQNRTDMCREVPKLRWDVNTHVDSSGKKKNTRKVRWGCWLENPDLFDASFFSISPREAPQVDPAQRIALMTAYEAMEQAGVVPGRTPSTREDRVGVFYGVTSNDWYALGAVP
jgi:hypothetical protein